MVISAVLERRFEFMKHAGKAKGSRTLLKSSFLAKSWVGQYGIKNSLTPEDQTSCRSIMTRADVENARSALVFAPHFGHSSSAFGALYLASLYLYVSPQQSRAQNEDEAV